MQIQTDVVSQSTNVNNKLPLLVCVVASDRLPIAMK